MLLDDDNAQLLKRLNIKHLCGTKPFESFLIDITLEHKSQHAILSLK